MDRRRFIAWIGSAVAAPLARAQQARKMHRVGWVLMVSPIGELAGAEPTHPITRTFVQELRALGYEEGRNLILERRSAEGRPERYAGLIQDLVGLRADVIVSAGAPVNLQVRGITSTTPVVIFAMSQPEKSGLVASLGRPGGNITGLTVDSGPENEAKRLQLLKEALPSASAGVGLRRARCPGPEFHLRCN